MMIIYLPRISINRIRGSQLTYSLTVLINFLVYRASYINVNVIEANSYA